MRGGRDQPSPPLRQQIREAKLVERLAEEMAEDNGSARVAPARPARRLAEEMAEDNGSARVAPARPAR